MKCPKCQSDNPDSVKFCGECGTNITSADEAQPSITKTIETPREELTTGSTFAGRYQIIEELGKGGMGKVYKALDTRINEKIALKLIKPEISSDKKTLERFGNELKLARKIAHKNVGKMFDINEEEGTHYITMEYVSGQDLKGLIRQSGQLAIGTTISITKQICEGLSEAHKAGVVHRDLKPNNIMIDREGEVRIMDFGIARSLKEKGITGAGVMIGTPEYMSPEQAEAKDVDQCSDIYSLGVILYEMVTGRVPFEGDTALSIAMKHRGESPKDPKEYNAQIPDDLGCLVLKCLEKTKENRYQNAVEVRLELENIEKGIPTTGRETPKRKATTSKEITVTIGLRKLLVPAVIFFSIIAIGLIIWQNLPQKQTSIAVLPFRDSSPQKDQEHLCDGMTDEIIAKLSTLQGWKVMNMASVLRYKNTEKTIKNIGKELNVTTVLLGSVRKEKDDIKVTAQLVNVEDEFQLWTQTYEEKLERVFEIQSDVAENIAKGLEMELSLEEKTLLQKKPTENLRAYNLYTQGRYFYNKRTNKDYQKAIDYYEQAIKEDPNYALAYSGIADSYLLLEQFLSSSRGFTRVKEAIQKALEIDDAIGEAHASMGLLKMEEWNWEEAERELKRALDLNPNYAEAHRCYAEFLIYMGRFDEAFKELHHALELNPFSLPINREAGHIYYLSRKYDQAQVAFKRTIEMNPNFPLVHAELGLVYLQKSMFEEALAEFEREKQALLASEMGMFQIGVNPVISITYACMGNLEEAEKIREQTKSIVGMDYYKACYYFVIGEDDKGFECLEKAFVMKESFMRYIKVDPLFDNIRDDPRYKEILKKMNLE